MNKKRRGLGHFLKKNNVKYFRPVKVQNFRSLKAAKQTSIIECQKLDSDDFPRRKSSN